MSEIRLQTDQARLALENRDIDFARLETLRRACRVALDHCIAFDDQDAQSFLENLESREVHSPAEIPAEDLNRFCKISRHYCLEMRTQLQTHKKMCKELGLIPLQETEHLMREARELSNQLCQMILSFNNDSPPPPPTTC